MRGGEARGKIVNDDNLQRRGYNGTSVFPWTAAAEPVTSPQPVVGRPTATASANGPGVVRWRPAGRYDIDLTPPQTGNTQSRVAWTQTLLSRTRDLREKEAARRKERQPPKRMDARSGHLTSVLLHQLTPYLGLQTHGPQGASIAASLLHIGTRLTPTTAVIGCALSSLRRNRVAVDTMA